MRFRFVSDESDDDREARGRIAMRIDEFWNAMRQGASAQELDRALGEVDERLVCDLDRDRRQLVISPCGEARLRPLVDVVLGRAPPLEGWELLQHRPPVPFDAALSLVEAEVGADLSKARARAGFQRGHLIDVVVHSHDCTGHEDERALHAALVLVEALLGERRVEQWIGDIDVAPLPRGSDLLKVHDSHAPEEARTFSVAELADTVAAGIRGVIDGLPDRPCIESVASPEWTLFELEPTPAVDYAAQDDLAMTATIRPEMLKCYLEGAPFSSERFSKHGETFCCVKIDSAGATPDRALARREAVEKALNDALIPDGTGAVVGNGLGLRYVYLDLALADLEGGLERTREVVRGADVSERAWVTFFDSCWADEWVPIASNAPAPPR